MLNIYFRIQYEKLSDSVCHSSSYMEMLDNKLSLNNEEHNGGEIVKHSKKHKRKSKEVSLEIANGNMEADLSECKRKSDVAENIKKEEYNGNEIVKHFKKHKRKSKEVSFEVANEDIETDLSKRKRKRDVAAVDKLESCEDDMLIQVESRKEKKHKTSFSSPSSANDVIIQNERSNNIEEIDTIPALADAKTITSAEFSEKSRKVEGSSKSSDIAVESCIQSSNCKKRKRKRSRKKAKIEPNLMGPFMSANKNSLQKLTEISPPIFNPCDNFAGIRKHIRFTSPTPESNNKEIETVDLTTNCSDSQAQISPNETCVSQNAKPSPFPTRQMYIDHANEIANKVYSKMSSSSENSCTLANTENSSLATSMTYADHVYKSSPKLSSKTGIGLSPTLLVSTNPTFANYTKPKLSSPSQQKSLTMNSLTASPMLKEIENKSSPVVSVCFCAFYHLVFIFIVLFFLLI